MPYAIFLFICFQILFSVILTLKRKHRVPWPNKLRAGRWDKLYILFGLSLADVRTITARFKHGGHTGARYTHRASAKTQFQWRRLSKYFKMCAITMIVTIFSVHGLGLVFRLWYAVFHHKPANINLIVQVSLNIRSINEYHDYCQLASSRQKMTNVLFNVPGVPKKEYSSFLRKKMK